MKRKVLQIDFNMWHYFCNMQCLYCVQHVEHKVENGFIYIKEDSGVFRKYSAVQELVDSAVQTLSKMNAIWDVEILTMSGTEPFLFDEVMQVVDFAAGTFNRLQIITNGICVDEDLVRKLETYDNVHVSLSLDGHTMSTNKSRVNGSDFRMKKALSALHLLANSSVSFEIYTVITKYNIEYLDDFFRYLENIRVNLNIQMWPVFGSSNLKPSESQLRSFESFIQGLDTYSLTLQPKLYFEEMRKFMIEKKRSIACVLPEVSHYVTDKGRIKACLCNGIVDQGNVHEKFEMNKIAENHPICDACFINWDMVNLYYEGAVDLEAFARMNLFSKESTLRRLRELKSEMKSGEEVDKLHKESVC